jgi:hypothetical protein
MMKIVLTLISICSLTMVLGCGSGSQDPQSIASPAEVNNIVEMRTYFDKAGGDWNKLSADDQAAYTKLAGDATKAQAMWTRMSGPIGGAVPGQR